MDLHITLHETEPLTRQIYDQVRDAIIGGTLPEGTRLPSTRELARSLGIARNTVASAFDHLVAEGYIHTRTGVGTYASGSACRATPEKRRISTPLSPKPNWPRGVPAVPELSTEQPTFDFRTGIPDDSRFPYQTWRRVVDRRTRRSSAGAVYADPAGPSSLRQAIALHVAVTRGLRIGPDDLVVTNGVQQAAALLAQIFVDPGDVVAVEDPGYTPVRRAFEAARAKIVGVPVDRDGMVVAQLPDRARLVYVTPAHQFPLGVRMTLARRAALLDWAERANAAVIEDDYDTDFRYGGHPLDPLHVLDRAGQVIYVGSFSKTMLPTLRIGYCIAPPDILDAVRRARFVSDWHGPLTTQLALAQFIDEGKLATHVRRMRREYEQRRNRIATILDDDFAPHLERIPNSAGMHLSAWSRHATRDTVDNWTVESANNGVSIRPISHYALAPTRPGLVLGFGAIPLDRIDEGLRQLRRVIGT